jgi:hypothetical protein
MGQKGDNEEKLKMKTRNCTNTYLHKLRKACPQRFMPVKPHLQNKTCNFHIHYNPGPGKKSQRKIN